jgi:hypothetical protein
VLYNPINFNDPTGHAYWGGDDYDLADDYEYDWRIKEIEEKHNVEILNSNRSNGLSKKWTFRELDLLDETLSEFYLDLPLDKIGIWRSMNEGFAGATLSFFYDGESVPFYNMIELTDDASRTPPNGNEMATWWLWIGFSVDDFFQGTFAHELTEVAINENPSILENWINLTVDNKFFNEPNRWIGNGYNWGFYDSSDPHINSEMLSMSVATDMYLPWWCGSGMYKLFIFPTLLKE